MTCVNIFLILFCTSSLVVHSDSLLRKTFRCHDGRYIDNLAFCNSVENCYDGSDENYGCNLEHCLPGQFYCAGSCLSSATRCDLHSDCKDGSDELHCGDAIDVDMCYLSHRKFLCHDQLRCLNFEYACDGSCNCFDCSDENNNCSIIDRSLLNKCPHSYFSTPDGPKCLCDSSYEIFKELCENIKNCTGLGICQQRCSQYKKKVQCSCYNDYIEIPGTNGFKCRSSVSSGSLLLYSTASRIKVLNLTTNEVSVVKSNVECAILTAARDYVYYVTLSSGNRSIFKTSIVSKITTKLIESESPIISMAVDYITNNIYFITNTSLAICSNDGRICTQLKCCNVSYVALAPESGLMFYTMKSNFREEQFIMKSNLDGSNENLFIDGTFQFPVCLSVEESTKELYWLEISDHTLYSVSFVGDYKEIKSFKYTTKRHVISFTVLESYLYFTKDGDNEIYGIENMEVLTKSIETDSPDAPSNSLDFISMRISDKKLSFAIRNAYAYNPILQSAKKIKNSCNASSCSGLCLLRSTSSGNNRLDHICICDEFTPTNAQHWCNNSWEQTSDFESIPKKQAASSEEDVQSSISTILFAIFMFVVLILVFFIAYVAFRKWDYCGCHSMIQNCISKSEHRMDIYDVNDL